MKQIKHGKWNAYISFDPNSWFGYVYQITDTQTNMKYIGSKQFVNKIRRKPLKGKKRVRLDTRTSDWLKYTGSSKALNIVIEQYINHIKLITKENIVDLDTVLEKRFTFDILSLHDTKFQLSYAENRLIYVTDAMLDEKYYNCFTSRLGNKKDFT